MLRKITNCYFLYYKSFLSLIEAFSFIIFRKRKTPVIVHTGLCSVCPRGIHCKVRKKVIPKWANPIREANLRWTGSAIAMNTSKHALAYLQRKFLNLLLRAYLFYLRSQLAKLILKLLIAALDIVDIIHHRNAFRRQPCYDKRCASP